jgi:anti-sigma regulatory factor (Ser/Thr protein kinase)
LTTYLSTYHDIRAIGIIRSFVAQTGRFFGADEKEVQQLKLASEEAAAFIIDALLPDKDESFKIECRPIDQGLSFYFENKGLPVDEENLPVYDSKSPTDSMDGLPFFLIESLTDAVQFQNRGNDGWVLIFEKRLKAFRSLVLEEEISEEELACCGKEKLKVTLAKPEDAYELMELTYFTYRYSYVKEIFYYRKELERAIETEKIIAFVGKNAEDDIAINSAFFRSEYCDAIAEAGMLMSRPKYRLNRALLRVTRMQLDYIQQGKSGLRVLYSNLVTAHTKSQRLLMAYKFVPTALKLSVHDQAEFVGLDTHEESRESLLYALIAPNGFDPVTLYVPNVHQEITKKLLAPIEVITLLTETAVPEKEKSTFTEATFEEDRYATLTVEELGMDWLKQIRKRLYAFDNAGIITVHLHIPADKPLPQDLNAALFELELFYSGVIIKTMQRWELVYTFVQGQHFDFDAVNLAEENAIALREYMRAQYRALKG